MIMHLCCRLKDSFIGKEYQEYISHDGILIRTKKEKHPGHIDFLGRNVLYRITGEIYDYRNNLLLNFEGEQFIEKNHDVVYFIKNKGVIFSIFDSIEQSVDFYIKSF